MEKEGEMFRWGGKKMDKESQVKSERVVAGRKTEALFRMLLIFPYLDMLEKSRNPGLCSCVKRICSSIRQRLEHFVMLCFESLRRSKQYPAAVQEVKKISCCPGNEKNILLFRK